MEEEKSKQTKSYKIYIIILLVIAVIFINPSSRKQIFSKINLVSESEKQLELVNEFTIDRQVEEVDIFNEKVIEWKAKDLYLLDFNGFEVLKKNFKFIRPDIVFGKDILYAMDKSSENLQLLDKNGETLEKLDLKVPFYKLREEGEKIYIYRKEGDKETVDIIDRKGSLLKTHDERVPILNITMCNKDTEYSVSTLEMDQGLKSVVNIYSIDGEDIGTIELKDEIVVYNQFIVDKLVIATEKNIYLIENGKIKWNKKIDNLKDIKIINKLIYVLYDKKFEILNLRGNTKEEIVLKPKLEKIIFIEDDILLFGKRNIIIPRKKDNLLNFKSEEDIVDVKYDNGKILIRKLNKVEIYNIKEKGEK